MQSTLTDFFFWLCGQLLHTSQKGKMSLGTFQAENSRELARKLNITQSFVYTPGLAVMFPQEVDPTRVVDGWVDENL